MSNKPVNVSEACTGCSVCVTACPFGAITITNNKAEINDACRVCGACEPICPVKAITLKKSDTPQNFADWRGVLVYAEQHDGKVHPVAYELLGKGKELATTLEEPIYAVVIGSGLTKAAEELIKRGANKVLVYDHTVLATYRDDPYSQILTEATRELKPSIFLIGATSIGRTLGPRVAAKLRTGLTADCTGLDIDQETRLLLQTRPAYGGNIMATIYTQNSRPQMATVRYKVMTEAQPDPSRNGEIVNKPVDPARIQDRVKVLAFEAAKEQVNIVDADIVVSGGKGLGEPKGFELVKQLADALGGAVGASRPTVDEGWIGYRHQVGLSGRTVRPKLYLACGISGSVQHQAGMKTSDVIIAINKDKEAPICRISTLAAVGDLYEVVPRLITRIKEQKTRG
ncbi:electron transfer flavoprotein subunit alpha [Candidatus Bathyarchaeota archaeon RBG_13_52_12]|nr:MAG: electron transfer flavoprotein subunit alpha [Candidatus Bathyarchaeota archaeon RBG_13_52_12]